MPAYTEPIILGGFAFEAGVRKLDLSLSSDLPRHPVEEGRDQRGHCFNGAAAFQPWRHH